MWAIFDVSDGTYLTETDWSKNQSEAKTFASESAALDFAEDRRNNIRGLKLRMVRVG